MTRPILVFDVNETLLDLDHMRPVFEAAFGDGAVLREWFAQLILYSQTMSLIGADGDFGSLGAAVLRMVGKIRGVDIGDAEIGALREAIGSMPAHSDAAEALEHLRDAGFRLVTLTNSAPGDGPTALDKSGLAGYFERSFSVAPTGAFKPAPQTYQLVMDALDVPASDLCLVACHVWDTMGLQALGGKGALVTHGVNAPLTAPSAPQPDIVADDLATLARKISAAWAA